MRASISAGVFGVALVVAACGGGTAPEGDAGTHSRVVSPPTEREAPGDVEAYAMPIEALTEAQRFVARRAAVRAGSADGVRDAIDAARLGRHLARRQHDGAFLERARRLLRDASDDAALPRACEAGLELARLEARDAGDLEAAWRAARAVETAFGRRAADAACVAEARRITRVLADHRPLDATDGPTATDFAQWAEAHASGEDARTLERLIVYGAGTRAPTARVVLYFDRVATFRRDELAAADDLPRRVQLDFGALRLAEGVADVTPVGAGGLVRVRLGPGASGPARVVLDVEPAARVSLFLLAEPYRVVIDVDRGDAPPPRPWTEGQPRPMRLVILDPGHGGDDHGAHGPGGIRESRLCLDLAERVKAILGRRLPNTRALLTRTDDTFVSLEQRTAIANTQDADVFVSIHLNAGQGVEHGGVTTFVLDTTNDRQALRLAARENGTSTADVSDMQALLAGLHRADQVGRARELAELVHTGTLAGGRRHLPELHDRGVKSAMFYVLVGARMPAVLVEGSFLTGPREGPMLAREDYRQALAEGIAEGLVRYARGD